MADDIKPASVYRPPRVRRLAREQPDENEERFRKKLAELAATESPGRNEKQPAAPPERQPEPGGAAPTEQEDDRPERGRNLDVRT